MNRNLIGASVKFDLALIWLIAPEDKIYPGIKINCDECNQVYYKWLIQKTNVCPTCCKARVKNVF